MQDSIFDTINTNGRDIVISGASLTVGNIVTLGNLNGDTTPTPTNDAGETIATAQIISSESSGVSLDSIFGTIAEPGDVDTYQIFVTGDGTFSASTVNGTTIDTQLFLFDDAGFGVYGNDDAAVCGGCFQSELPAGDALTPTSPGIYYLAISEFGVEPVSDGGNIFPDAFDTSPPGFENVEGPTGAGGTSPLTGFDGVGFDSGDYTVSLTGVEGTQATFNEAANGSTQIGGRGSITLNATNGNVNFTSLDSSGDSFGGGDIIVNATGNINSSNGTLSSDSFFDPDADAGAISLNSSQGSVNLTNISVTSNTFGNIGNAGNVNITANSSIFLIDTGIDAAAFGTNGRTGNVNIKTTSENGSIQLIGRNFNPVIFTDTFAVGVSGQKTAGDIAITGGSVIIDNYTLNAIVNPDSTGNGGDIRITGDSVSIQNNSEITVETLGPGNSGNTNISAAGDITIDNSEVSASTSGTGIGGNININTPDSSLKLRNNSEISANVQSLDESNPNINAGNININAKFIIAFPSDGRGNDIITTAQAGQGGDITLTTDQVFNLEKRDAIDSDNNPILNNTNDIDASSETRGLDGVITISPPDVNPLQGVDRLTTDPVSTETIATEVCSPEGRGSSLIFKGKGGLPPVPTEPFMADVLIPDGKPITIDKETDLNSLIEGEIEQEPENPSYVPADIKPIKTSIGDIYPARGIIKTEDGKIILTRYPTDNINTRTPRNSSNCSLLSDKEQGRTSNN